MVPGQEPFTTQLLLVVCEWFVHNYTSTCGCVVFPPGSTKTSVCIVLPIIVVFISGAKCPLNKSKTSIPTGALFYATRNQSFISSLVIQSLGWHLTTIPPGSWTFNTVLQFRVMYGGNLLPLADTVSMTATCIFSQPSILSTTVLPQTE
jgi:hypothetical protein